MSAVPGVPEKDNWEKEDPNLLNNPELLYRECEKYPPPKGITVEQIADLNERNKMLWDLFYDHYNDFLDDLESEDPLPVDGNEEEALQFFETVTAFFNAEKVKVETLLKHFQQNKEIWTDEDISEVFDKDTVVQVMKWKHSLQEFLDAYQNIRQFIPPGTLEENQETEEMKAQKEQLARIPTLVEDLEELIGTLNIRTRGDEGRNEG